MTKISFFIFFIRLLLYNRDDLPLIEIFNVKVRLK
jgi:hypothetical protein